MAAKALTFQTGAVAVAGALALFGVLLASAPFIRIVDNALRDGMVTTISPWTDPTGEIVLVTVTEDTLSKFAYRSPVDRKFLADTLTAILAAGPKAIGLDILFDQPTEAEKDDGLRQVLRTASHPVITAYANANAGLTDSQIAYLARYTEGLIQGAVDLGVSPIDGTVRMMSTGLKRGTVWIPGFAAQLAVSAGMDVPAPGNEPLQMTYYRTGDGLPYAFKRYPAEAAPLVPAAWFKGKIVLIGVDLLDSDRHRTPFHILNGPAIGDLAGIEIHAHGLAQLLAGERLRPVSGTFQLAIAVLLCAAAIAIATLGLHPVLRMAMMVALCVGLWGAAMIVFQRFGILLPLAAPTLAVIAAGGVTFALVWYRDRQQRAFIEDAFSHYVSPAYVDRLIAHPEELHLGGERRNVSYIFTDIAGFTTLSEQTDPEVLSELLNGYLDGLCSLFLEHGATIDKIIGDAVVGFIGAPVDQPNHAAQAVQLVLDIDDYCEAFRQTAKQSGHELGETRVGAHTGVAVIGNFGGTQFFDYTGFGDTVNIAARLEGANKYFGTRLCVSATTAAASGWPHFRPVGTIVLKGKTEGVDVFEPVPEGRSQSPQLIRYLAAYEMLKACDPNVLEVLDTLALDCPEDRLVAYQLDRLRRGETGTAVTLSDK